MIIITSKEKLLKSLIPTKHVVSCRVIAKNKRKFGMVERACLLIRSGVVDGHNTPPNPREGYFLFSPLFLGLLSLRGDALFSGPFLSWQVASSLMSPTSDAAPPDVDVPPPFALVPPPFALSGASSFLHA